MIKDFETVKTQLKELSGIINSFNSETVQLKIIELIFKGVTIEEEKDEDPENSDIVQTNSGKRRKARNNKKGEKVEGEKKNTSSPKGRPGPSKTLDQLVTDGYFKTKKTIGEIVKHCNDSLALTYKATDLSGILMKLVRDRKLKREKNPGTNQYEYSNA